MTEWEKAQNGYLYDANYDKEIIEARTRCADLWVSVVTRNLKEVSGKHLTQRTET